jgi:hypothetical protein
MAEMTYKVPFQANVKHERLSMQTAAFDAEVEYRTIVFDDGGYRKILASHRRTIVLVCNRKRCASGREP